MNAARAVLVVAALLLTACSSDDPESATTSVADERATTEAAEPDPDQESGDRDDTSVPGTTEVLRDGVVAFEGSVEALILDLPEARNFAAGVGEWLDEVPGQEGVLRNSRGITVFVPVDEGFSEAARDEAFADPDVAAATIGEHLHVGALAELDGSVVVATGTEYEIGDDGETIGIRRVVGSVTGTNGVVYLIAGPLTGDVG